MFTKPRLIHRRGTRAAQPAANGFGLGEGTLYFVTDENVLERSNGTTWEAYSGAAAGTLTGSLTTPRVPYASGATTLADNALFFWDNSNNRLFAPTIVGGTGVTDDLILQTTSGAGVAGSWMFFKVGNNGATTAMEINSAGLVGIGTTGLITLASALNIRQANPPDIGYVLALTSNLSCFVSVKTGTGVNEQAGFNFYQQSNDVQWLMAVVGNDGDAMRWRVVIAGSPTVVFYATKTFNIIIDSTRSDPASGSKVLVIGDGTAPGNLASNTAAFYADDVSGTVQMFVKNEANEVTQLSGDMLIASGKFFITQAAAFMIKGVTSWTNGAGASAGTLTNAPSVGDPTKWIPVDDNGTTRYIPAW